MKIVVPALLLTVLTGFTGLVYEVIWQKYLATLLGSHSEATAAVLAIFLGGLALGYALFGRATRWLLVRARERGTEPRLLYFYALLELGIGLYALVFPWLVEGARVVSLWGPVGQGGLSFAFDVMLSALLLGPPAVLMGGTVPILTLALSRDVEQSTRIHAWVYGFNTVGAFLGAIAAGFLLVPLLGLDRLVQLMGCLNLVAAAIFAQLDAKAPRLAELSEDATASPRVEGFATWAVVALLAGFGMMALQTTANRIGALSLGSSEFTFAMVVAVFVLCIALGSLLVSALPRIPRWLLAGSQWLLVGILVLLYLGVEDAPYWAHLMRVIFRDDAPIFYAYHATVFRALFAVLLLPIGISGALLPLLFHELRRQVGELGAVAGRLYAWNTLGSLLGALLGGYLLLFWLDLHQIYRIAISALALAAALSTARTLRAQTPAAALLALVPVLVAIWWLPAWEPERLATGLFRNRDPLPLSFSGPEQLFEARNIGEVIFYDDDPTASVAVVEPPGHPEERGIVVNGKSDGNLVGDYPTMALSALIPALVAETPRQAFVIGWGTGVTAGELASLSEIESVRVAEISQGVIDAAPLFDIGNLEASKNPKIEILRSDAYRALQQSSREYDLIISEPSNPWVTGVEMLYSQEFLEAARSRLSPGGVYAQWFHLYESDPRVVALVLRTYASVFPNVSVWFALGPDLLLLGFDRPDPRIDLQELEARFRRPDFQAGFGRVGIDSFPALLAHELIPRGTLHAEPLVGEIHSLHHPILSHRAAQAFYRGRHAWIPAYVSPAHQQVSQRNSLLRAFGRSGKLGRGEVLEAAARESCRFGRYEECATLLARWRSDEAESPRLRATLEELRKEGGRAQEALKPGRLAQVEALYGGRIRKPTGEAALRHAQRLTKRFLRHYHHAVPFERRVLDEAWERCQVEGCAEQRERAEGQLGDLQVSQPEEFFRGRRREAEPSPPMGTTEP